MAGGIFISYRRGDSPASAGRLYDRLENAYSGGELFMDVDGIEPGLDFVEVLNERVANADVLLAIIGRDWLSAVDETGGRRLLQPNDFVRIEIEAALKRNIRVIPVLVDGASPPPEHDLPDGLKSLTRRQAVRISHERFASDADLLLNALSKIVPPTGAVVKPDIQPAAVVQATNPADRLLIDLKTISNIVTSNDIKLTNGLYMMPNIPAAKLVNATARMPHKEAIHILLDCTVFGSAKYFAALGESGLQYVHGVPKSMSLYVPYERLKGGGLQKTSWTDDTLQGNAVSYNGATPRAIEEWRKLVALLQSVLEQQ